MSAEEAKRTAEEFLATRNLRDFVAVFSITRKPELGEGEWSVIFDLHDKRGHRMDGPMIVLVDEATSRVRVIESP